MTRFAWTPESLGTLRRLYPDYTAEVVARVIGCGQTTVWHKARQLGVRKSAEFLASQQSGRIRRGESHPAMVASQFKPGLTPWNKGMHYVAGGRSAETRFKPGRPVTEASNYVPIGTLRTTRDGYLERKVNDTDPKIQRRWVAVHRLVWEAANGPIPDGWIVVFKRGMRTTAEADITTDRLECIDRAEHAKRNHPRSRNPELGKLAQLKGQITRQVNRIAREHADRNGNQPQTGATT